MLAKEVMRRKVVTVESWLTLQELAKLYEDHGITGAPVVDADGSIVGVVSQTDLVHARRESSSGIPSYHHLEADEPTSAVGMSVLEFDRTRVEQIMTPGAISFDEETEVGDLAKGMLERHIHRVLITRGEKVVGIITTMDLLRALAFPARKRSHRRTAVAR